MGRNFDIFQEHVASMVALPLVAAFGGVRGTIVDAGSGLPVPSAALLVTGTHRCGNHESEGALTVKAECQSVRPWCG
jgi:hypothetical protein